MSVVATPARHPAEPRSSLPVLLGWGLMPGLLMLSWYGADMRPMDLVSQSGNMAAYAADFFPPNFRDWRMYLDEMLVTIQIAIWGTFLAIAVAVPLGLLC